MMILPSDAREAAEASIQCAVQVLGERLRAVYALGSLGYGGYVPGWSDLDLDLVVDDRGESAAALLEVGLDIRTRIHETGYPSVDIKCYSVPILNAISKDYEYGNLNRAVMIRESAQLIYGVDIRLEVPPPPIEALRAETMVVARTLLGKPDEWWDTRPIDDTGALLALPGRLLITSQTGSVVGKGRALEYLLAQTDPPIPDATWPWVVWALACRLSPLPQNPAPASLKAAQAAARALLAWVVPLQKQ